MTPTNGNSKLAAALARMGEPFGAGNGFRETLLAARDEILARLGITSDELAVLITANRWRGIPAVTPLEVPETAETRDADEEVAEAAAACAGAQLAEQQARDPWLTAKAKRVLAQRERKPERVIAKLQAAESDLQDAWATARAIAERAQARATSARLARDEARRRAMSAKA